VKIVILSVIFFLFAAGSVASQVQPSTAQFMTQPGLKNCIPAHVGREPCRSCHLSGPYSTLPPLGNCSDCHVGPHGDQLIDRKDGGDCASCHDVLGFMPVRFDYEDHRLCRFPLDGAHRAVPCNGCHQKKQVGGEEIVGLRFETLTCNSCHTKIPEGHIVEIEQKYHCSDCHITESWHTPGFDHNRSKFLLTGRHKEVACRNCHKTVDSGAGGKRVRYLDLGPDCAGCHDDPHAKQFAERRCEDCHTPDEWKPTRFDHQQHSSFLLEGKHLEIECNRCHRLEPHGDGELLRRFKPMRTDCRACHDASGTVLERLLTPDERPKQESP
jgi:Cytochrome c7 and related cytochrome c